MVSGSGVTKNLNADLIKAVATIFVVMIHVVATTVLNTDTGSSGWYWANIIDSFCRVAPPLFFMTSGAFLLTKNEPLLQFFIKRASKILIPTLFWSLLYITFRVLFSNYDFSVSMIVIDIVMGSGYYHLWFLNAIIVIYLLTPLLRMIVVGNRKAEIFIVICMFALSWSGGYFGITPEYFSNMLAYIGYFIAGHLFWSINTKPSAKLLLVAGVSYVAASVFTSYNTMNISISNSGFDGRYYGYSTINITMASFAIFIAMMQIKIDSCCQNIILKISSYGFGIYLAHPLILRILGVDKIEMDLPYKQVLYGVVVFAISYFIVLFMKKSNTLARLV